MRHASGVPCALGFGGNGQSFGRARAVTRTGPMSRTPRIATLFGHGWGRLRTDYVILPPRFAML